MPFPRPRGMSTKKDAAAGAPFQPTPVRASNLNSNDQRQGIIMAMVSCLLLFLTAYGILGLVQQIGTCRGEAPPSCCARPLRRLKAPLGLSLLRCACKREFSILFSGEQQAGKLTPLLGVHLSDNFQHPFRGDLDAVRQIFFYRHRAGFGGTDVL